MKTLLTGLEEMEPTLGCVAINHYISDSQKYMQMEAPNMSE